MPAVKVYYTKSSRQKPEIIREDTMYDAFNKADLILTYWDDVEKVEVYDNWGDVRGRGWPRRADKRSRTPIEEIDKALSEGKKSIRV